MESFRNANKLTIIFFQDGVLGPAGKLTIFDMEGQEDYVVTSDEALQEKAEVYQGFMEHVQTQEFVCIEDSGNSIRMIPKNRISEIKIEVTEVESNDN